MQYILLKIAGVVEVVHIQENLAPCQHELELAFYVGNLICHTACKHSIGYRSDKLWASGRNLSATDAP
jgi:hypothetical protein